MVAQAGVLAACSMASLSDFSSDFRDEKSRFGEIGRRCRFLAIRDFQIASRFDSHLIFSDEFCSRASRAMLDFARFLALCRASPNSLISPHP